MIVVQRKDDTLDLGFSFHFLKKYGRAVIPKQPLGKRHNKNNTNKINVSQRVTMCLYV